MWLDFSRQLLLTWAVCVGRLSASPTLGGEGSIDIIRYAKSAEIHNYLNVSHDPCNDFYKFTCGNYYRINNPIAYPFQSNVFRTISKSLSRKFAKHLQAEDEATDTATDRQVKRFYESCMQAGALQTGDHRAKLIEIINEFGQMPALAGAAWREADFDWLKTVAEIAHKYDKCIIVGHVTGVDVANVAVNRLHIITQEPPLGSESIYIDDAHRLHQDARKGTMAKNLVNFFHMEMELAEKTANEIFEFETKLFGFADHSFGNEDVVINLTTLEEMQSKYFPKLDIKRLLTISLGWLPTDPVYDLIEDAFDGIANALEKTPKRIVANYIFYYLIVEFKPIIVDGSKKLQDLCVETTKLHFAKVLDNMVYRSYATKRTEADVEYMWQTIKTTFHHLLQSDKLSWMKPQTRKYALEKLQSIRLEINSYQLANFSEEFGSLALNDHDYIENVKAIFVLKGLRSRAKLSQPPKSYDDAKKLSFTPVFIRTENLIKVPVSILQPYYLWSDSYPNALKFGTLGFLIAHELIHGFDEEGRNFDRTGNRHPWWDKDSYDYFDSQSVCFSAQYAKYIYEGRPLPELDSQSENIADNGGIRLAYDAYLRWYEDAWRTHRNMDLETMPRLSYTSKQLFFISYGQLWCSATHPVLRNFVASVDSHAPSKFRVLAPLSNLKEFSKEFNCPVGSAMNPKDKCIIY